MTEDRATEAPVTAPAEEYKPDLERLKKMVDEARSMMAEARKESILDRDYYDGNQLTATERSVLQSRGQPQLIINRVRPGVNGVLGVAQQGRSDPRAYMRNPPRDDINAGAVGQPIAPGSPAQAKPKKPLDAADIATMTLRYVADMNQFQPLKMDVFENICVEGAGAAIVEFVDGEISIQQIRFDEFFADPRSKRADYKDARYMGVFKWMYADDAAAIYPEKAQDLTSAASGNMAFGADATWEDRPENITPWIDSRQKRLVIVDMYHRDGGVWYRCEFFAGGLLAAAKSPYLDDNGQPTNPIEAQSAYVDKDNKRYGMVRDMRGPQDEINMRRSKLLHLVNTRQIQQVDPNAPPIDAETARAEAAKPSGIIPAGWQIVPTQDMSQGQALLLQEAKSEIERMGPNPAILGRQGADSSGRAQQIRQQAGITELARLFGRFESWELRTYKQIWSRARQFYTDPKWIRVSDDDGAAQYLQINEPGPPQLAMDPATGQPVQVQGPPKNHVAKMDVDIVLDTVPDTATLRQEQFATLVQLAESYGPQAVPFTVLIEMSEMPKKHELLDKLEAAQAEQAQAAQPAIQLATQEKVADINKTQAETAKTLAETQGSQVSTVTNAMAAQQAAGPMPPPGMTGEGQDPRAAAA